MLDKINNSGIMFLSVESFLLYLLLTEIWRRLHFVAF